MLFVIIFDMGVTGVAWATLIAQAVSAILIIITLCRGNTSYRVTLSQSRITLS